MRPALLLPFLAACHPDPLGDGTPAITILEPAEGDVVCGAPLHVELDVQNFELVAFDAPEKVGTGHVDCSLNGQVVNMTTDTTFDLPDREDGEYRLQVDLVNSDHTPIEPYVGQTVYFTIDAAACGS
jgi:hypothetical protein